MAPRSIWKGTLGFGMVSVPCKLYTATEEKAVHFNQIHRECQQRIQMPKWCPTCDRKVEADELVKGYEVAKGEYVLLDESDMAALPLKSLKRIEVLEFIEGSGLDPRQANKSYFIAPDEAGPKSFSLLLHALGQVGLVGVVKLCMREREHLATIRPFGNVLLLQTMFYSDELRNRSEYEVALPQVSEKELEMAITLVKTLDSGDVDLGKYQDEYRDALLQVIQAKLNGETISVAPAEAPAPAGDLVDTLMASIQAAQKQKAEAGVV